MNPTKSPTDFARTVLGVELTQHQGEMLDAVVNNRKVAIAGCHASGKSFAAAVLALWWCVRHKNARVLILSPTWMQVKSVLWHEIHALLRRARLRIPLDVENQVEIRLDSSLILGLSTNDSGRLQGHHGANMLIIVDEATAIPPDFWPSIEGILAGGNAKMVLLGNPVSLGYFSDCFSRNRASWRCISISAFDTPNLAGLGLEELLKLPDAELDNDVAPYLITRRWTVERFREWWNGSIESSPLWQSRVLGEFPSSGSNALFPIAWLEVATRPAVDPGGDTICAVDPAGPGKDLTAAVACRGSAIVDRQTWSDADSRGVVVQWLRRHNPRLVRVDSAGLGFYFTEHLRDAGYRAIGVNVASKPEDEQFVNLKAQRYWRLRQRFERGEISGLDHETLGELASIQWLVNSRGQIEIESKASVKSTLGRSPDRAEALMLCLGEGAPQPFEYRAITAADINRYRRNAWPMTRSNCDRESSQAKGEAVAQYEDSLAASGWMHNRLRFGRGSF